MHKRIAENKTLATVLAVIISVAFAASLFYLGFTIGRAESKHIIITGLQNAENPADNDADFSIFWQAWDTLRSRQINGKDTNPQAMIQGAIRGLAGAFDDPYTVYFDPEESKFFTQEVKGNFGGIGAEIGMRDEQLIIVAPLKDSPAEAAGLKAKDKIIEIDEEATAGMSVDKAVKQIRGEPGTKVTLTISREGMEDVEKIEITRQIIRVPTVDAEMDENKFLHLNLYQFNENAEKLFADAVTKGIASGMRGMILDLRNNPGGYLNVAVDLAGWFVKRGSVVVNQQDADGSLMPLRTYGNERLRDLPIVVLVNEGSASASEILGGALRDLRRVKIVGVKTYGKGTVQELDDLKDGSTLKITIAHWLLPSGKAIDKNGIEPDYEIELDEELFEKNKTDTQLNKAVEILKSVISE